MTGCAGFIGSNLVDHLLGAGHAVVGIDDLSTGRIEHLDMAERHGGFRLVVADLLDAEALAEAMTGCDLVYHLAANADVRRGPEDPGRDLEQNTVGTYRVLEAMRATGVRRLAFASSAAVYGDATIVPTPEDSPFPRQTSSYGASKAAAEGFIAAYCEAYDFTAVVLRLVAALGPRYGHGHVVDFVHQLREHPEYLDVLGDGHQRKSYVHVSDVVRAFADLPGRTPDGLTIVNIGTDEDCEVRDSVRWITERLGLDPVVTFEESDRGWIGDSPLVRLDCAVARRFGWAPRHGIRESVVATVDDLVGAPHAERPTP